ncbi:hypothetical protein L2E82_37501 [Cichorium intybus]|uniref:Uncharacterized protein n=1 Tax=Cichorium intybus TaxID=13427 RepID=A0ACB9AE82_CICIN|nr:hypothetical protein L2E82_37501 [Cichorium intybus]
MLLALDLELVEQFEFLLMFCENLLTKVQETLERKIWQPVLDHVPGLTLDSQRNHFQFYQNSLNQNQEVLDSRYVGEEEEDHQGVRIGFNGFQQNRREDQSPVDCSFHRGLGGAAVAQPQQKKRSYLFSSVEDENAPGEKMEESYQYQREEFQRQQLPAGESSRLGLRKSGGEIVEVQGGHIVRATGRKDRHSKVCTAKGPRDRRVRLAAHTAIQFYDVQDRLGYDRPSKAVDWLIKKAKAAIDELDELPAWKPTSTTPATNPTSISNFEQSADRENQMGNTRNSSFLPPSLDSDYISDTIKSFFPMGASSAPANNNSSTMQFHQNFSPPDLLSRSSNQSQDLRLSLQSFKDPIHHHHNHHHQQTEDGNSMFLDTSNWPERMVGWGGGGNANAVSGGFVFSSPPTQTTPFLQTLFTQTTNNHLFNNNSQRGPLQSSNTPSIRAWIDQPAFVNKRKTTASPINRHLLPPILAIDSPSFFLIFSQTGSIPVSRQQRIKKMI